MGRVDKIESKFKVTFDLIKKLRPTWLESNDYEKAFIETILGATIFYLPTNKDSFSGMISENASKVDKKLRVKEHQYPRKISSKELFINPPKSVEELKEIYYNTYGVWNWVTKTENTSLREHQKDGKFKSPEKSYKDCGVKLIQFK